MERKLKVLVWSDLVIKTGFSRVSQSIFENLNDKLDLLGLGVNYKGDPQRELHFPVFPAGLGGDPYGINRLREFVRFNLDFIFILNDAWVVDKMLSALKQVYMGKKMPKIVTYIPVDAEDHDPEWYTNFDIVDALVTYTEFGKRVILEVAPQLSEKIRIIPHGVDTDVFFRMDKKESRLGVYGPKTNDNFIFLNANRNQPRKKLDITLKGFQLFADGKNDVSLHMHCGITDMHMNITKLAIRYGIDKKLVLTNLANGPQQISERGLNFIYNSCDVGINTCIGEGWGLPSVEHACTGALQIVPNHSSCAEIFKDCGLLIPANIDWTYDISMTRGKLVTPEDVAKVMEIAYTNRELCKELSEKAYNKFTSPEYSWKKISEDWYKLFEELYDTTSLAQ